MRSKARHMREVSGVQRTSKCNKEKKEAYIDHELSGETATVEKTRGGQVEMSNESANRGLAIFVAMIITIMWKG